VLKSGEFTEPIRTKQGYVILKVVQHIPGGPPAYKDVEQQVEDNFYMSRMEPAIREYLTKLRVDSFIDIKPGYTDTGASPRESKPVYSAYVPPSPKKKHKVERTRFRETTHTFRQKTKEAAPEEAVVTTTSHKKKKGEVAPVNLATMKPGKKEKIRFGKAPAETLPDAKSSKTEDAGALPATADASAPANPLEAGPPPVKTRFSERAKTAKTAKVKGAKAVDALAPPPPDSAEVADRQTQAGPLGLAGDTATKKKKKATTTGNKTRMTKKKKDDQSQGDVPLASAPTQAPAPASNPASH
jgi:peptidyl-prolyl cis-trans isomerase SurA